MTRTYDSEGRLTDSETVITALGSEPIFAIRARYDEEGRMEYSELSGSQLDDERTTFVYDDCDDDDSRLSGSSARSDLEQLMPARARMLLRRVAAPGADYSASASRIASP